jgi:hypothetical protein
MKMTKPLTAFFLGLLSFFVFMAVGEAAMYSIGEAVGLILALILMLAYFFICQFFLSRGNPDAYRRDWPIMLALDAGPLLLVVIILIAWENRGAVFLSQGLGILVSSSGGTFAGAVAASRSARRKGGLL